MNILTNGSRFAHADVDRSARRLGFLLPGQPEGGPRHWWGRLERGDEVVADAQGPRIELLDEAFRPLTDDLRRPLLVSRSGVVHLRIHGKDEVEVRVTRFPGDAVATAERRPFWTLLWAWVRHGLGSGRAAARWPERAVARCARPSAGKTS